MSASPTILGALVTRFDANITNTSKGLWVGQVPEAMTDQSLPFYALIHEGEIPEYTTEKGYRELVSFRFEIFQVGLAAVEALALAVKNLFDLPGTPDASAALSVANAFVFTCARVNYQVDVIGERTSTGDQVFRTSIFYKLGISKTLP